jgi:DNA-directed RNA polymerase specialized sigma24 family protein
MKIPKNMTADETLDKIELVINRIAPKYTFHCYDVDDIKQESFIICVEALDRYDEKRPLENFLSVNLSNRLKNFVRDNFGHAKDVQKKKITSPTSMSNNANIALTAEDKVLDRMYEKEIVQLIDAKLDASLRSDYLKYINGITIPKSRRDQLIQILKDIVNEER